MPLRYSTVVFDLDGTLIDSYEALAGAVNHARAAHSMVPLTRTEVQACVGEGVEKLLERVFSPEPVPSNAVSLFEGQYDELCNSGSRLLEDVRETLEVLAGHNVRMAVCTNKPTSFSAKILHHLGIASHFKSIVGPDLAGARKPAAGHLLRTLELAGHKEGDVLFIGDMPIDVLAARAAHVDVAVLATGSSSSEELEASNPDYFLGRFSDIPSIVVRPANAQGSSSTPTERGD